ncbi:uncharacterized protein PAC_10671 [Phialocephala subalpina]|uniref:Uncharacterized protein n=1 Tax=Phialocephala subalpina TaxID=576137 RepID=A0A1L7X6X8_9HELO|nr:uncharacterized protein PAC_10671 [Phialocephala subalpina]
MDEFSQEASQLNISEGDSSWDDMSEDDTPHTPFDPRDIATLLSNYYQLMARMRYFSPDCIKYPPHDPPIDVEFAKSLDLEPQVIELLQVLPYVEGLNNEDEFILSGSFADMRQKSVLEQSRDPDYVDPTGGYDEENGKYVMPWMLVLNECGNHGSIMYFNTRNSKITMVWQGGAGGGCADPYFWGKHSSGDEDPHEINDNRIEQFPSRPATDLFADFTNRLMTLEWIPFNTYGPRIVDEHSKDEYPDLKLLFETYGWPGELDAEGFDAASRRWKEFNRVRSDAQDMLTKADLYGKEAERLRKRLEETLKKKKRDGVWDEDIAKTPEDIAKMEEQVKRWQQNLEWEEKLRGEAAEEAEGVHDWDSALEKSWKTNISDDIRYHRKNLDWYRGGGAQYATEDKIRELEVGIAELEKRLQDIDALPKTAFDAIKPQLDRQWLSAR